MRTLIVMILSFVLLASSITLSATIVVLLSGIPLPVIVDLVSKSSADRWVKEVVLAALSIAAGLISTTVASDGSAVITLEAFVNAAITYAIAWVSFRNVPPVRAVADRVQVATARVGVG